MAWNPRKPTLPDIVMGLYGLCFCLSTMLAIVCAIMATKFCALCVKREEDSLLTSTAVSMSASLTVALILNELSFSLFMVLAPLVFVANSGFTHWSGTIFLVGLFRNQEGAFGIERNIVVATMGVCLALETVGELCLNKYWRAIISMPRRPAISSPMMVSVQQMKPVALNNTNGHRSCVAVPRQYTPIPF
ncbi:hypothetical protein B0H10DRAFT_2096609 [Mycena sp. CBHHK59/15]|nr:hypothetical protein B0H10DRAFT_2096609 [Mycena sp. CBHHK59/15]